MSEVRITYIGHASFYVEWRGEKIFVDPWLKSPGIAGGWTSPVSNWGLDDVKEATVVLVTHGHIDHIGHAI